MQKLRQRTAKPNGVSEQHIEKLLSNTIVDAAQPQQQPAVNDEVQRRTKLVSITFEQPGQLGIVFDWPTVYSVSENAESSHPELKPGLRIIGVQGRDVEGMTIEEGHMLYRNAGRPIRLTFREPTAEET